MHMAFNFKQRHKTDENATEYTLKMGSTETNTNGYKIIVNTKRDIRGLSQFVIVKRKVLKYRPVKRPFHQTTPSLTTPEKRGATM